MTEAEKLLQDERAGLLLHLPVPLGTTVWRVRNNPACHYGVRKAEIFLFGKVVTPRLIVEPVPFALPMLDDWGKTVFQTEREGRRIIDYDTARAGKAGADGPREKEPGAGGPL